MLTDEEKAMLAFEHRWWKFPAAKDQAIRMEFDMSSIRYYQRLNALINQPAADAHDPTTVRRLRRLRGARQAQRSAARLARAKEA